MIYTPNFPCATGCYVNHTTSPDSLLHNFFCFEDPEAFKAMLEAIKQEEEARGNTSSPVFQLQVRESY